MYGEHDLVKILFAENPAMVIQVDDTKKAIVESTLDDAGIKYFPIGMPSKERTIMIEHEGTDHLIGIDFLRDVWPIHHMNLTGFKAVTNVHHYVLRTTNANLYAIYSRHRITQHLPDADCPNHANHAVVYVLP